MLTADQNVFSCKTLFTKVLLEVRCLNIITFVFYQQQFTIILVYCFFLLYTVNNAHSF